jgi:hypothetical protein
MKAMWMKGTIAALVVAITVLAGGCAATQVRNQWKDPSWAGPPATSVLVVGISRSETTRRLFEDTFVKELQADGLTATASYTQVAGGQDNTPQLTQLVKSSHADIVLATRVQSTQQKTDVSPGYVAPPYGGFWGWYGSAWMAEPPLVSQYEVVTLETTVWDTRTEKLIWSITTERVASKNIPAATVQLAQTLIPRMKAQGIIR